MPAPDGRSENEITPSPDEECEPPGLRAPVSLNSITIGVPAVIVTGRRRTSWNDWLPLNRWMAYVVSLNAGPAPR